MYQLKAHFMPQLYWFGLIKVVFKASYNFKIVIKIKKYNMKENHFEREKNCILGLVGGPGHLQEGAPLRNEIKID